MNRHWIIASLSIIFAASSAAGGYAELVDRVQSLEARLGEGEVLAKSGLAVLKEYPPLPPEAPKVAQVFAITQPRSPRQREPWRIQVEIPMPMDIREFNRLTLWVNLEGADCALVTVWLESKSSVVNALLPADRQTVSTSTAVNDRRWTRLVLDFPHADEDWRKEASGLRIRCEHYYPPKKGQNGAFRLLLAGMQLERVSNPRKWQGWNLDPHVITVNQVGYKPLSRKVALADPSHKITRFTVRDIQSNRNVFSGEFERVRSSLGEFLIGDFSEVNKPGRYVVESGELSSVAFSIVDRPYAGVAKSALEVLRGMRCGIATSFHEACHLDAVWDGGKKSFVDLTGGYHDLSDMTRCDAESIPLHVHWLMRAYRMLPPTDDLSPLLLEEATWGLKTLEKHFQQCGKLVSPSLDRHLTDNKPGTDDDWVLDERDATSHISRAAFGLAELALATRESQPDLARRAVQLIMPPREIGDLTEGGLGATLSNYLALYRVSQEETLREAILLNILQYVPDLLSCQENRVFKGSNPAFSGMFALTPARQSYWVESEDWRYQGHIRALADLMETLPTHTSWYKWYFAARRYADFYVKSGRQFTAPYVMPIDIFTGNQLTSDRERISVGSIHEVPYYCPPMGRFLDRRSSLPARMLAVYTWVRLAGVLDDPELEHCASELLGSFLGLNPFNWVRVSGFGEDPLRVIECYYPFVPGMVSTYLNPRLFNRFTRLADDNAIWSVAQMAMVLGAVSLDSPCLVRGRITSDGLPYVGEASIRFPKGNAIATFSTAGDGAYGPVAVPSGGWLELVAGGVTRRFAAVAGARPVINMDLQREAELIPETIRHAGVAATKRAGFYEFVAGQTVSINLYVRPIGKGRRQHTLRAFAENALVNPGTLTVALDGVRPMLVGFQIIPKNPGQTMCLLIEMDEDRTRKWELSAIVESVSF